MIQIQQGRNISHLQYPYKLSPKPCIRNF
jgi:hypothetical protein